MSFQYVYLARHGLTKCKEIETVQGFDDVLTEEGIKQAMQLSKRAANIPFEKLYSSDLPRAEQTAAYIAEATGKEILLEPLFREMKQPTSFAGQSRSSQAYLEFVKNEFEQRANQDWRFEDAENFTDVIARTKKAAAFIAEQGETPLFIISHGYFILFLTMFAMFEGEIPTDVLPSLTRTLKIDNTGITILKRDTESGAWSVVSVNDLAHFAE